MNLFGESGNDNHTYYLVAVVSAIAAATPIVGAWFISLLKARAEAIRVKRQDAIGEWQAIVTRQEAELLEQKAAIKEVTVRVFDLARAETECQRRLADTRESLARQDGLIAQLSSDLRRLQVLTHDLPPATITPCIITAAADDRIIRVTSASSGPILGWMPNDLIGKKTDILVPPALLPMHLIAMNEVQSGKRAIDPSKPHQVQALRKDGSLVDVIIHYFAWMTPKGQIMVNAEIRPFQAGSTAAPLSGIWKATKPPVKGPGES